MADRGMSPTRLALIVAGVVVVCCTAGIFIARETTYGPEGPSGTPYFGASGAAADAGATTGVPVRDGSVEFTVRTSRCGVASVGTAPLAKTAAGQFCEVSVQARNTGTVAAQIADGAQQADTSAGETVTADSVAGVYANSPAPGFAGPLPATRATTAILVFDIPKNATLTSVTLHAAAGSPGATVALS